MQPRPGRSLEQDLVEGSLSGEKGRSWEDVGTGRAWAWSVQGSSFNNSGICCSVGIVSSVSLCRVNLAVLWVGRVVRLYIQYLICSAASSPTGICWPVPTAVDVPGGEGKSGH
jgi:hypothetical protein